MEKRLLEVSLLSMAFLLGCNNPKQSIKEDFDNTGKELIVTVTTYDSYQKLNDNVLIPAEGLQGQAHLSGNTCDIKLYKPRIVKEDDEFTLTLGHELMHCLYGNYHINFED